jgi:uncharacterized membrane protein YfcA
LGDIVNYDQANPAIKSAGLASFMLSMDLLYFAILLLLTGVVAGLLAGLFGVGGGAVLVPVFFQAFGALGVEPSVVMHVSIGTSLAIIIPTSIRSFLAHKSHGAVDYDIIRKWFIVIPLGVFTASFIASIASGDILRLIFALIATLVAIRLLINRPEWIIADDIPQGFVRIFVGYLIGLFSALMGIGGGIFNNTFMTLFGRPIHQAVATSAGVGVLIAIPGLIGYVIAGWGVEDLPRYSSGFIYWPAVILVIPTTLVFAPIGAKLAHKLQRRQLEIGFGVFLILVAVRFFVSFF